MRVCGELSTFKVYLVAFMGTCGGRLSLTNIAFMGTGPRLFRTMKSCSQMLIPSRRGRLPQSRLSSKCDVELVSAWWNSGATPHHLRTTEPGAAAKKVLRTSTKAQGIAGTYPPPSRYIQKIHKFTSL